MADLQERVLAVFNKLADADGYVTADGLARLIMIMMCDPEGPGPPRSLEVAQSEAMEVVGSEGKKLASELAAGDVGEFLAQGNDESNQKLRMMEAALFAGDRVGKTQLVDATSWATAGEEECTKVLKEKVIALFQAVAGENQDKFTKDQLLKYALGLAQSGSLAAMDMPTDAPERVNEMVDVLFEGLDASCDGKVEPIEAYNYALSTFLKMAGCSSVADMPQDMKMQLMMAVAQYGDLMLNAGSASGADRLAEVTKKLKEAFDAADLNGNGFLEKDELRAGCLVMARSIAKMSGGAATEEEGMREMEGQLDGFIAQADPEGTGKVSFEAMLAVALPGLCEGQDPAEFFAQVHPCDFTTIKMQIDLYLGGFSKK